MTTPLEFYERLGDSWEDLADVLEIPRRTVRTFKQGHEAREIWRWLVERERQDRLPRALTEIGREDLAALMAAGPVRKIAADVTDFTALIDEHTAEFVGRRRFSERLWAALDDDAFGSGYLFVHGEPGIGKTALLAKLVRERNMVHHFNSALLGVTSREHFLRNVCAQLIPRYELPYERLPADATYHSGVLLDLLSRAAGRLAPDQDAAAQLRVLETAVMQAASLVADEPGQLYRQLLARVPRGVAPDLDKLLVDAARWRERTWLRPLAAIHGDLFLRSFGPVNGFARAVAISDDAAVVLVGDGAGGLSAWDTDSGEQLWAGRAGAVVNAVAYRPGSFEALVALGDGTVARWSLADRRVRPFARDPDHSVAALAVDENTVLYGAGATVHAYDASRVLTGHTVGVDALTLTPDGTEIVSVSRDSTWRRWSLVSGTAGPAVRGSEPFNSVVAVSPDGMLVATATQEHTVEVWDRLKGRRVLPPLYGHTGYVERLTFTPDGRTLLSGSWDHSLRVWDLATGEQQACFEHPKWVSDLVLTSDGRLVMTASGGINVFDLAALEPREPFAGHDNAGHEKVWNLALAPDDRTLFSIGDQTVRAWDVATRTQLAVFPSETSLNRIAIAGPDLIVVGTSNGAIVPFRLERATRSAARRRAGGGRRA